MNGYDNRKMSGYAAGTKIDVGVSRGADLVSACNAMQQKESPVGEAMSVLDTEIRRLENNTERLIQQLQTVLRPIPPDSVSSNGLYPEGVAELPTRIITQAVSVGAVADAISTLLSRLVL